MIVSVDKQKKDVTDVMKEIKRGVDEGQCCEIFAVCVLRDSSFEVKYSGNWHNLALSSAALQTEFDRYLNGMYQDE